MKTRNATMVEADRRNLRLQGLKQGTIQAEASTTSKEEVLYWKGLVVPSISNGIFYRRHGRPFSSKILSRFSSLFVNVQYTFLSTTAIETPLSSMPTQAF